MSYVAELMTLGQKPHERQLESQLLRQLEEEFARWLQRRYKEAVRQTRSLPRRLRRNARKEVLQLRKPDRRSSRGNRDLLDFLLLSIGQDLRCLEEWKVANRNFRQAYSLVGSSAERKRILLDYAETLGQSRAGLRADAKAFERHLGEAAMNQRCLRRIGEKEQFIEYKLKRFGAVFRQTLRWMDLSTESLTAFWQRIRIEEVVRDVLAHAGDVRLDRAALRALRQSLAGLPTETAHCALAPDLLASVRRFAEDQEADVWTQRAALELLEVAAPAQADQVLQRRLPYHAPGDDIFLRRAAVRVLARRLPKNSELVELLATVAKDPSAFVRQQFVVAALRAPADVCEYWLHHLLIDDHEPKVRAATLQALLRASRDPSRDELVLQLLERVLDKESHEFVLRVALHVAAKLLRQWHGELASDDHHDTQRNVNTFYGRRLLPRIRRLQVAAESVRVRRWAALAAEQIWCELHEDARRLRDALQPLVDSIAVGSSKRISSGILVECDAITLGRVLAVLSQDDYGLDIHRGWWGYRLARGPRFSTRAWRIVHELCRPATDKRQAVRHTIGRVSKGVLRAPSAQLAEISQTKVPGEPLFLDEEAGWRPYLPLLDDFLSVLDVSMWRPQTVRFVSAQGVTEVTAPRSILDRIVAAVRISWSFERIAELRNWTPGDKQPPSQYLASLRQLGFTITFRSLQDRWTAEELAEDDSITPFFAALFALSLPQLADLCLRQAGRFSEYFRSVFENSLPELVVFAAALLLLFLGRLILSCQKMYATRQRIALSLGGWGTRGKSGTERLKAALIGSLGYSLVSKTTGCEAMFLRGETFGETREFPLFRPFDKATIWEHHNVLKMAGEMDSSVFLWECMALNPTYVEVLQKHWTRDDLATIVNAYPDHEDIQGPAGWNVARVIAEFTPLRAHVLTTEQQMMPILREASRRSGSIIRQFGWLESGLITDEILARFPYSEHPDNVALVIELAKELGVDADFAVKEMADSLIADLGVLRTYPVSQYGAKRLEFTNGCSANERFACLGNWQRSGFANHNPLDEPFLQISTVVNNRADRVARSRVFASILVNDLSADRHVLIGDNLKGLLGFIWEAWDARMEDFSLWSDAGSSPAARFAALATELRQATTPAHVRNAIAVMLRVVANDRLLVHWESPAEMRAALEQHEVEPNMVEEIIRWQQWWLRSYQEYQSFADLLVDAGQKPRPAQDVKCCELLKTWFQRKLVVIADYHATGEQIIHQLHQQTPPGFINRVIGLQNIKGTGLDFVYRWQAWQQCYEACNAAVESSSAAAAKAIAYLRGQKDFGLLGQDKVRATLRQLRQDASLRRGHDIRDLEAIQARLNRATDRLAEGVATENAQRKRIHQALIQLLENSLDLFDSLRRRRKADAIYQDLATERIAADDAIAELRRINKQQKGGWLLDYFASREQVETAPEPMQVDSFDPNVPPPEIVQEEFELEVPGSEASSR